MTYGSAEGIIACPVCGFAVSYVVSGSDEKVLCPLRPGVEREVCRADEIKAEMLAAHLLHDHVRLYKDRDVGRTGNFLRAYGCACGRKFLEGTQYDLREHVIRYNLVNKDEMALHALGDRGCWEREQEEWWEAEMKRTLSLVRVANAR